MTQLAKLVDRPAEYNFPIETISMAGTYDDDCATKLVKCPDKQMIVRADTMEYLGCHSIAYKPVTHAEVLDPIIDLADTLKTPYVTQINMIDNGAMMDTRLVFKEICFDDPAMQDYVAFQISVRNSYNGVWSIMIQADGLRMFCMNKCTTPDTVANFRLKHNGHFRYNFEHLKQSVDLFRSNETRYREWYNTKVTQGQVDTLFTKLSWTPRPTIDGKYRNETQYAKLQQHWREYQKTIGKNKWGLYNAVTHWISHPENVSSSNKSIVERNSKMLQYMKRPNSMFA
tara:strand:- start:2 stop:856 length:855 start_codon:yes stop_codon:yes gene_type:complete